MTKKAIRRSARITLAGLGLVAATLNVSCANTLPECPCVDPEHPGCKPPPPPKPPPPIQIDYLLVQAESGAQIGKPRQVEISSTPQYDKARESVVSAAIRLPEECLNESAAQVTGEARRTQAIVKTRCGTWLAELEKALVKQRFRVVSWDSLRGLITSQGLPAFSAAKQLGADVLFLFNSLEAADVPAGGEAASKYEYFHSDDKGAKGEPFPLMENERAAIRDFAAQKMADQVRKLGGSSGVAALSSTLDSTAILTSTGESIWFYRNTTLKPVTTKSGGQFLFAKYQGQWFPARREMQLIQPIRRDTASAQDVSTGSVAAGKDPYATERLDLVRAVAEDFVMRFRDGTKGDEAVEPKPEELK